MTGAMAARSFFSAAGKLLLLALLSALLPSMAGSCDWNLASVQFSSTRSSKPVNGSLYLFTHKIINPCSSDLTTYWFAECATWPSVVASFPDGNVGLKGPAIATFSTGGVVLCRLNYGGADGQTQIPAYGFVQVQYYRQKAFPWCSKTVKWRNGKAASIAPGVRC